MSSLTKLIILSVVIIGLLIGAYFLFFKSSSKSESNSPVVGATNTGTGVGAKAKTPAASTGSVVDQVSGFFGNPTIPEVGKAAWGKRNDVNGVGVNTVYNSDGTINKTAKKKEWLGTITGSQSNGSAWKLKFSDGRLGWTPKVNATTDYSSLL